MEKIPTKAGATLLAIMALGIAGCGPNYSGEGNEFVVLGQVTDPGKHSLKADIYKVEKARGEARGWFDDHGEHQIHDNCDCSDGIFDGNETVGHVVDIYGYEIDPEEVAVESCVKFVGKIRADQEGKVTEDRPVYDVARIVEC